MSHVDVSPSTLAVCVNYIASFSEFYHARMSPEINIEISVLGNKGNLTCNETGLAG